MASFRRKTKGCTNFHRRFFLCDEFMPKTLRFAITEWNVETIGLLHFMKDKKLCKRSLKSKASIEFYKILLSVNKENNGLLINMVQIIGRGQMSDSFLMKNETLTPPVEWNEGMTLQISEQIDSTTMSNFKTSSDQNISTERKTRKGWKTRCFQAPNNTRRHKITGREENKCKSTNVHIVKFLVCESCLQRKILVKCYKSWNYKYKTIQVKLGKSNHIFNVTIIWTNIKNNKLLK